MPIIPVIGVLLGGLARMPERGRVLLATACWSCLLILLAVATQHIVARYLSG